MKPAALLLAPGASATRDHSTLVAIESAVAPLPVERIDLAKTTRAETHINRVREEAAVLVQRAKIKPAALALGGRSMGGRMCSMAVAEGLPAAALVLISYPLHPPGKHDKFRVDHFGSISVPCLFVSGTKDPFGSPDEFDRHTEAIAGPVTQVWIDGGAHGLKGRDDVVAETVRDWLRSIKR